MWSVYKFNKGWLRRKHCGTGADNRVWGQGQHSIEIYCDGSESHYKFQDIVSFHLILTILMKPKD